MTAKTLTDKTILITGGTSRLGRAFVPQAVTNGARVFFTYYQNQQEAEHLKKKGAEGFRVDLADAKEIETCCAALKEKIGHLDVLIHNAAAVRDHTVQNLTDEDWDYVMTVNLKAPYYFTKKLMPLLFRKKSAPAENEKLAASKVFMLASRVAVIGGFGVSNYAASKAGLLGLMKSLAQELGKRKILVNAVNPGFMKSPMTEGLPEEVTARNLEASALARFSDPEEVAAFLVYLSSDAMTQVTGQTFHFESRKI